MNYSERILSIPGDYNLRRTMWLAGMGYGDPARQFNGQQVRFGVHTPEGLVCIEASRIDDIRLNVRCFGNGTDWIESRIVTTFGLHDEPTQFQPDGKAARLLADVPGIHLPRLPVLFERLLQIVLQQLVSWNDAFRGWRLLVKRYGVDAPGPVPLRLGPTADRLRELGYYDLVACHILPKQARLLLRLAKDEKRIERLASEDPRKLENYLLGIPGIGEWTVQYLLGTGLGDPDAVITGDYGLPNSVAWYFIRKPRSDDSEMLRLLEPYRGHRFRVLNALWQSGVVAPKYGPKMKSNRWRFANDRQR